MIAAPANPARSVCRGAQVRRVRYVPLFPSAGSVSRSGLGLLLCRDQAVTGGSPAAGISVASRSMVGAGRLRRRRRQDPALCAYRPCAFPRQFGSTPQAGNNANGAGAPIIKPTPSAKAQSARPLRAGRRWRYGQHQPPRAARRPAPTGRNAHGDRLADDALLFGASQVIVGAAPGEMHYGIGLAGFKSLDQRRRKWHRDCAVDDAHLGGNTAGESSPIRSAARSSPAR